MTKQLCQYQRKGCQHIASYQHFIQLNFHKLDKGYICSNCKQVIEKK